MTDYLAQLLKEQEEEQEQDVLGVVLSAGGLVFLRRKPGERESPSKEGARLYDEAGAAGRRIRAVGKEDGQEGPAAPDGAAPPGKRAPDGLFLPVAAGAGRAEGFPGKGKVFQENGGVETQSFTAAGAAMEETGKQGAFLPRRPAQAGTAAPLGRGPGADWLYRRLSAGEAAAGYQGQPRSAAPAPAGWREPPAGAGVSPAELDKALERDARRYDAGFSLF